MPRSRRHIYIVDVISFMNVEVTYSTIVKPDGGYSSEYNVNILHCSATWKVKIVSFRDRDHVWSGRDQGFIICELYKSGEKTSSCHIRA